MRKLLVVALSAALSTTALAAESHKLTLDVTGVECGGCAKALSTTLGEGGLKVQGNLAPSKKDPSRIHATAESDVDLGALASKLEKVKKPHPEPAGLFVVLFAKVDKDSAKKAEDAVGKVKGVDKKGSKVDEKKGEISVKIAGSDKVTLTTLVAALKDAGIAAASSKEREKEPEKAKKEEAGKEKKAKG